MTATDQQTGDLADRSLAELMRLGGRTVVVTGGASGIGLAICRRMREAGATVVVADRAVDAAHSAADALGRDGDVPVMTFAVDASDEEQVRRCAADAVSRTGRLDIWVNNAGIFPRLDPLTASAEEMERVLRLNVLGVQFGMAAAVAQMRAARRPGVVVNIASTAAYRGSGAYSASKWAVRGLTCGLAPEVGRYGIRVVALAPTVTRTPGMAEWLASAGGDGDVATDVLSGIPLGRMCEPDDVARAAVFVASDAASFITGVTLPVDGGSLAVVA